MLCPLLSNLTPDLLFEACTACVSACVRLRSVFVCLCLWFGVVRDGQPVAEIVRLFLVRWESKRGIGQKNKTKLHFTTPESCHGEQRRSESQKRTDDHAEDNSVTKPAANATDKM